LVLVVLLAVHSLIEAGKPQIQNTTSIAAPQNLHGAPRGRVAVVVVVVVAAIRKAQAVPLRVGAVPLRVGALPLRVGALPLRVGALPLRVGAVPLRVGAEPLRVGAEPLRVGAAAPGGKEVQLHGLCNT